MAQPNETGAGTDGSGQVAGHSSKGNVVWIFRPVDDLEKHSPLDHFGLEDAGKYITKLSKAEHEAAEWLAAMEALILVAMSGGPTMFARIGVMRALNRRVERVFNADRKDHHWGRRKLARDRRPCDEGPMFQCLSSPPLSLGPRAIRN